MREVAMVAFAQAPSLRRQMDFNEPRMIMPIVNEVYEQCGLTRSDIDFTVSGSADYLAGASFAFIQGLDGASQADTLDSLVALQVADPPDDRAARLLMILIVLAGWVTLWATLPKMLAATPITNSPQPTATGVDSVDVITTNALLADDPVSTVPSSSVPAPGTNTRISTPPPPSTPPS